MTNEQANSIAQAILDKLTQAGFIGENRPARSLKECADKLEALRVEARDEIKAALAEGVLMLDSPFDFMVMGKRVPTWQSFHGRVSCLRNGLNNILKNAA